jgi:hypothetical protein
MRSDSVTDNGDGTSTIVLSGDYFYGDFAVARAMNFTVNLNPPKTGILVPTKAIRSRTLDDGTEMQGVYILIGNKVLFREVELDNEFTPELESISLGDYTLFGLTGNERAKYVKFADGTEKLQYYLAPYQSVVVSGTELYDGKVII